MSKISVVLGSQWGDEGKGKLVDILGAEHQIIVRSGGGSNAGHTIVRDGKKYVFHLLPSGLLTAGNIGVIGNGCVVHLPSLVEEITELESQGLDLTGKIFISDRAHLLFDYHKEIDGVQEERKGGKRIGTTKQGIGPCYADKISRCGIRAVDILDEENFTEKFSTAANRVQKEFGISLNIPAELAKYSQAAEKLKPYIVDVSVLLENFEKEGKNILIEGAQAFMLDIDFGTYPFVTSSSINVGGMGAGCGISPRKFSEVIGVVKAYCTRVGSGPFPSELEDQTGEKLRKLGGEFGATTGRPRRCGWIDLVALKNFVRVNHPDNWNITKLDILSEFDQIGVVTGYTIDREKFSEYPTRSSDVEKVIPIIEYRDGWNSDISQIRSYANLPKNAQKYIEYLEEQTGVFVKYIGVGVENDALIVR